MSWIFAYHERLDKLGGAQLDHRLLLLAKQVDCHMPTCEGVLSKMQPNMKIKGAKKWQARNCTGRVNMAGAPVFLL